MHSIALIVCYFGSFPWYFGHFLKTCEHNPSIKFIIISDNKPFNQIPNNISFYTWSLQDLSKEISKNLGFPINITDPYKLCDFKPAYGQIFQEIIKDYQFWGHIDIDVIFGNIRNFMTDEVLDSFDVFSTRSDYLTGYFTLYRNNPDINALFKHSKDYRKVFQSKRHFCFDECNFLFFELRKVDSILELKSEIESMSHVAWKLAEECKIRLYLDMHSIEGRPGNMCWSNGTLIYDNEFEALLYHLIDFKKYPYAVISKERTIPQTFYVTKFEFLNYSPLSKIGQIIIFSHQSIRQLRKWISKVKFSLLSLLATLKLSFINAQDLDSIIGTFYYNDWTIEIEVKGKSLVADLAIFSTNNDKFIGIPTKIVLKGISQTLFVNWRHNLLMEFSVDTVTQKRMIRVELLNHWTRDFVKNEFNAINEKIA